MNRSYSKIRHILQANLMLERRMMSEKIMLVEEDRVKEFTDAGINQITATEGGGDMTVQIIDSGNRRIFYTCMTDPRLTKAQVDGAPHLLARASFDDNFKDMKGRSSLTGNWEKVVQKNCTEAYNFVNSWREQNCPKLSEKTFWNYANECKTYISNKTQVAAAETPVAPVAPAGMSPEQIAANKDKKVKEDQKTLTDLTNFFNSRLLMLDKEDGTLKTDQELETDVKTWNSYLSGQGDGQKIFGGTSFPLSKEMRTKFRSLVYNFGKSKPNLTQPNGGFNAVSSL